MKKPKETCFISQDTLLELANESECSQQLLFLAIVDIINNKGTVVVEIHYVNAPRETVATYVNLDDFMQKYCYVFNKINL